LNTDIAHLAVIAHPAVRIFLRKRQVLDLGVHRFHANAQPAETGVRLKFQITGYIFIYFWPHIMYNHYEKAIRVEGFGDGPIPVNTLYTEPLASQSVSSSNMMTTGVDRETLLTAGWLDLSQGPQVLHVPDMAGRY
jgi:hypothetical protein